MDLSDYELNIINDTKFLTTKFDVITKVSGQLDTLNNKIHENIYKYSEILPAQALKRSGKVSRGENYQHLPYLVLDSPRVFEKQDIFVFRSMFWWGHEYSFTLHLQGQYLAQYLPFILDHFTLIQQQDVYVCINSSPWQYYFEPDNHVEASSTQAKSIIDHANKYDFFKLSSKLSVEALQELPDFGIRTFDMYMQWLMPRKSD
jgi:hypothetical protein